MCHICSVWCFAGGRMRRGQTGEEPDMCGALDGLAGQPPTSQSGGGREVRRPREKGKRAGTSAAVFSPLSRCSADSCIITRAAKQLLFICLFVTGVHVSLVFKHHLSVNNNTFKIVLQFKNLRKLYWHDCRVHLHHWKISHCTLHLEATVSLIYCMLASLLKHSLQWYALTAKDRLHMEPECRKEEKRQRVKARKVEAKLRV